MGKKESLKDNRLAKGIKKVIRYGSAIGGSALIGCLLKKADSTGVKGIAKIAIPLGIFGLAHAAGNVAAQAAEEEIDRYLDIADEVRDVLQEAEDDKVSEEDLEFVSAEEVS